jgi:hypothetical protein
MSSSRNASLVIGLRAPRTKKTNRVRACGMGRSFEGRSADGATSGVQAVDDGMFFGTLGVGCAGYDGRASYGVAGEADGVGVIRLVCADAADCRTWAGTGG